MQMTDANRSGMGAAASIILDEKHRTNTAQTPTKDGSLNTEAERQVKAWEKPGRLGDIRRTWCSIQRYIWDDPEKPQREKKFLRKLDFFLLTYACLGYFCKNLDQANLNNAYVSGLKEAIGMERSELMYASNVFTAGYVVSQLPAVILVTCVRPSYLIPTLEILWSIFTFSSAAVKSVKHLYALRFLMGLCEGAFFPSMTYLIGAWYTKSERGKRVTIFYSMTTIASTFSGYLQAAAYDNLDGKLGHAGWHWLFIICGIILLPVGVIGYFFDPDFPETTRTFYLNKSEAVFARERLLHDGYKSLGASAWDRNKLFRIMKRWQLWILSIGYMCVQCSFPSQQPAFSKAEGKSVYELNVWPTGHYAIGTVVQVAAGMLSDSPLLRGKRWQAITFMQAGTFFGVVVLAVWNIPIGLKYTAYYAAYMCAGTPGIYFSWFPDLLPGDHEGRGFLIALSNVFGYIMQIWYADAVWRMATGPRFHAGFIAAAAFVVALGLVVLVIRLLEARDTRNHEREVLSDHRQDEEYQVGESGNKEVRT